MFLTSRRSIYSCKNLLIFYSYTGKDEKIIHEIPKQSLKYKPLGKRDLERPRKRERERRKDMFGSSKQKKNYINPLCEQNKLNFNQKAYMCFVEMLLKIGIYIEGVVANGAFEAFPLDAMRSNVSGQLVPPGEGHSTDETTERLVAGVGEHVPPEVSVCRKGFVTMATRVGPETGVDSKVFL